MWKIYSKTLVLGTALSVTSFGLLGTAAFAQTGLQNGNGAGQPLILPNSSSSYNQQGFSLPTAPSTHGQDIVRGSGGISCQSAIGSGGPSLDMGVIGSQDIFDRESTSFYGRVTVPLGKRPKRVDCSKLYDLEINRLKMELQMMRAGAFGSMQDQDSARNIALQASRGQLPEPKVASMPETDERADRTRAFTLGGAAAPAAKTAEPKVAAVKPAAPESKRSFVSADQELPIAMTVAAPAPKSAKALKSDIRPTLEAGTVAIATYGQTDTENGYYAQIGAFSSIENAKKAWWQSTTNVPGDLTDYSALAKPKRKGDKTLYLLQAGPFTKQATQSLCKKIGKGCYPVKT